MLYLIDTVNFPIYVDDNFPYCVGKTQCQLKNKIQKALAKLFK